MSYNPTGKHAKGLIEANKQAREALIFPESVRVMPIVYEIASDIWTGKSPAMWSDSDLFILASMATNVLLEQNLASEVAASGAIEHTESGATKPTAAFIALQKVQATILSQARSLQVHSRARNGESRDIIEARLDVEDARALQDNSDDGLLA